MIDMSTFEKKFNELMERLDTSTYKLALSVGEDPSRMAQIVYKRKPVTFEKRMEALQKLSASPILDVDFGTLAAWLAMDYLPQEALKKMAMEEKEARDAS